MANKPVTNDVSVKQVVSDILDTVEREREREIVARRFGLFDRKETLEQIGELLGITRERVRQLEKVIVTRLKASAPTLPHITEAQNIFISALETTGKAARVSDLTAKVAADDSRLEQSRVAFIAELCPKLVVIDENDFYHNAV